jgi:hypothetical protein
MPKPAALAADNTIIDTEVSAMATAKAFTRYLQNLPSLQDNEGGRHEFRELDPMAAPGAHKQPDAPPNGGHRLLASDALSSATRASSKPCSSLRAAITPHRQAK